MVATAPVRGNEHPRNQVKGTVRLHALEAFGEWLSVSDIFSGAIRSRILGVPPHD